MLVRPSKPDDARLVGGRLPPLWRALTEKLRGNFVGNDLFVPSVDVVSETLGIAYKKNGVVLVFKFAHWDTNTCTPGVRTAYANGGIGRNCSHRF